MTQPAPPSEKPPAPAAPSLLTRFAGPTLANGGIVIEFNDGFELDAEVRSAADEVIAGLTDGSMSTRL